MFCVFFFFRQKTAYEMRISDWSSDVCSSDLVEKVAAVAVGHGLERLARLGRERQRLLFRRLGDFPVVAFPEVNLDGAAPDDGVVRPGPGLELGRALCRERVCQYV